MPVMNQRSKVTQPSDPGGVTHGIEDSHSLLDSNPACDFKNSWNCGDLWASSGTHIEAMRYSSCDSAVDLWADVVRDEHICEAGR